MGSLLKTEQLKLVNAITGVLDAFSIRKHKDNIIIRCTLPRERNSTTQESRGFTNSIPGR